MLLWQDLALGLQWLAAAPTTVWVEPQLRAEVANARATLILQTGEIWKQGLETSTYAVRLSERRCDDGRVAQRPVGPAVMACPAVMVAVVVGVVSIIISPSPSHPTFGDVSRRLLVCSLEALIMLRLWPLLAALAGGVIYFAGPPFQFIGSPGGPTSSAED